MILLDTKGRPLSLSKGALDGCEGMEADMTKSFTKWDVTEHLRTHEDARLYLEACAEEDPGDGSLICAALNDIARAGNMIF